MKVAASGAVIGQAEKDAMHAVVERGWLTAGPVNREFEQALEAFTGIKHARTCNSGSSANLLAVAVLVESGFWRPGDYIITTAACFPTTVNPLLLYGLVPVFVDIDLDTLNANVDQVSAASGQAKGIMLAHTLGNPFSEDIYAIAHERNLRLVEDCCDALGARHGTEHVGSRGDLATCSFFPAHHITTGEGGAVFTQSDALARKVESIRDWGRDCWCAPGENNSCGKRFEQQHGDLPYGYDHKTVTTALGFNLKSTEIAAACGLAQMARLGDIVARRKENFERLRSLFLPCGDKIHTPVYSEGSSPFGFSLTLKETGQRDQMQAWLAQEGVDSRLLFAGNITRQPYMRGRRFVVSGALVNTDKVMHDMLWIGCHPELTPEQLHYAALKVRTFLGDFE